MKIIVCAAKGAGRFLFDLFAAEKAPYLVALFIAAVGWTIVRTTDRMSATPLVEYLVQTQVTAGNSSHTTVRVRNITTSVRFSCFELTVASVRNSSLRFDPSQPHGLVIRGGVLSKVSKSATEPELARFIVQDFNPGADLEIGLKTAGNDSPRLLASPCLPTSKENVEPVLIERSPTSRLVEHELFFLWLGLLTWLVLILLMFAAQRSSIGGRSTP